MFQQSVLSGISKETCHAAIATFAIEQGISFRSLSGPAWRKLVGVLKGAPHSYIPPDRNLLSGRLLDEQYEAMQKVVNTHILNASMARMSIASDGMTYMHKPFENYYVLCDGKVIFHSCEDCTDQMIEGKKDGRFIAEGVINVIKDVGPHNVLSVIMDGASNMQVAGNIITAKYPWVSVSHCLLHVVNLVVEDCIKNIEEFGEIAEDVADIANFFNNHHAAHAQLAYQSKRHLGHELALIIGSDVRMGKVIYCMHRVLRLKKALMAAAASADLQNSVTDGDGVLDKLMDPEWWKKLVTYLSVLWPLHHLLRMTDFDKPIIGYVYPYIRDFLSYLQEKEADGNLWEQVLSFAESRLGNWCGDLPMAAYFVNPFYFDEVYNSVENSAVILQRVMKQVWHHLGEEAVEEKVMQCMAEWASYKTRSGPLHDADMKIAWKIAAANKRAPAQWWRVYGTGTPHLMEFAVAVLSQFVTAGACERGWKRYKVEKKSLHPCVALLPGDYFLLLNLPT